MDYTRDSASSAPRQHEEYAPNHSDDAYTNNSATGGEEERRGVNTPSSDLGSKLEPVDFGAIPKEEINRKMIPHSTMSEQECVDWCLSNSITISGSEVPKPILEFEGLRPLINEQIFQMFKDEGHTCPTAIQAIMWPSVFSGKDFIGISRTGSGKTLGFLIPAVMHVLLQVPVTHGDGPIVTILTPTRELAIQIRREAVKVTDRFRNLNTACLYGGNNMREQANELRALPSIVVSTPGRLIDMVERKQVKLYRTSMLVLDEADSMLDSGFSIQLKAISSQIRPDRQLVLLSATWAKEIEEIAAAYTYFPITVRVGSQELLANCNVRQNILAVTDDDDRHAKFMMLVGHLKNVRSLIFVERRSSVQSLHELLLQAGVPSLALHGDMEQEHREKVIEKFRQCANICLVATNIASRGLDIKGLDAVINYTFPTNLDDYVHRIGRTGRAGVVGSAFSFVSKSDNFKVITQLINVMKRAKQSPPACLFQIIGHTAETFPWDADLVPTAPVAAAPTANFVRGASHHAAPLHNAPSPHQSYGAPRTVPSSFPPPPPPAAPPVGQKRVRESTFSAYGDGPGDGDSERW